MENPWFGRKANGYTGGPVTWQGWLISFVCIGGAIACDNLLDRPANLFAAGGCIVLLIFVYLATYDKDTESY